MATNGDKWCATILAPYQYQIKHQDKCKRLVYIKHDDPIIVMRKEQYKQKIASQELCFQQIDVFNEMLEFNRGIINKRKRSIQNCREQLHFENMQQPDVLVPTQIEDKCQQMEQQGAVEKIDDIDGDQCQEIGNPDVKHIRIQIGPEQTIFGHKFSSDPNITVKSYVNGLQKTSVMDFLHQPVQKKKICTLALKQIDYATLVLSVVDDNGSIIYNINIKKIGKHRNTSHTKSLCVVQKELQEILAPYVVFVDKANYAFSQFGAIIANYYEVTPLAGSNNYDFHQLLKFGLRDNKKDHIYDAITQSLFIMAFIKIKFNQKKWLLYNEFGYYDPMLICGCFNCLLVKT